MKISFMLKREDFYQINRKTLEKYYQNSTAQRRLYIYPELNAIVTARPSKAVRQYLYTEFRVNGSAIKRLLVRLYAMALLNSGGLLARKSLWIKTDANADTLIYPCNKKYRVFDFKTNQVSVFAKDGFPGESLKREIDFRRQRQGDFVPGLVCSDEYSYTEMIIDGCPVARTGEKMPILSDRAWAIWRAYITPDIHQLSAREYAQKLREQIKQLCDAVCQMQKKVNLQAMNVVCATLLQVLENNQDTVSVSLSHGDLQPGNIWVEKNTDRIYIIDWESWERRSIWYDEATLYQSLRRGDGVAAYAKQRDLAHATVLLEDIIFRLTELTTLPCDYGSSEFDSYIKVLQGGNADV